MCAAGAVTNCSDTDADVLKALPLPEAIYVGYAPVNDITSVMFSMPPVGDPANCGKRPVLTSERPFTLSTMVRRLDAVLIPCSVDTPLTCISDYLLAPSRNLSISPKP